MHGSRIKDPALAPSGREKIEWVARHSPVLNTVRDRYLTDGTFDNLSVAVSLPVEAKTAYLAAVLAEAGASVALASPGPFFVQDDVAATLSERGVEVHASSQADPDSGEELLAALGIEPDVIVDDRAGLARLLHTERRDLLQKVRGVSEETTSGVAKLAAMHSEGVLAVPAIAANDARCKHLFDNRYGTGQSTLTAIMQNTNLMLGGKRVVVLGYGWCGKGIARYAAGLGARVTVCETDPVKGLEAYADGNDALPALEAAKFGEVFITATGSRDVLTAEHFARMRDGAILTNAGGVDVEIDVPGLAGMAPGKRQARGSGVEEFVMPDGRRLDLIGGGRVVNITAGDGHPVEIMDLTFSVQALAAHHLANRRITAPGVHLLPAGIDDGVAATKLESVGMGVDSLSAVQKEFLTSWRK